MRPRDDRSLAVAYVPTLWLQRSETFVRLEVRELRRQGVRVEVLALRAGDLGADGEGAATVMERDRPTAAVALAAHATWLVRHPGRYRAFLRLRRRLGDGEARWRDLAYWARWIGRRDIDVVHAHFGWSSATRAWGLATLTGLPWSMTLHANDIFGEPDHLEDKIAGADAVVTVCDYNVRTMGALLDPARAVEVVICGVELPPDTPTTRDLDVVAVGRLVPKKGFDLLVRAWPTVLRHGPATLTIVGDGPLRAELEALAVELGVRDAVRFTGAVDHDAALGLIARARVFALPFRIAADGDRDSMPVVVKEAMARSVPVVSTDVVAVPEMVDDRNGWLVPPDDPEALARALVTALGDPAEAERRGRAARARVEREFTLTAQVGRLHALFDRLAAR
ncbi:MAG TPA: glycosyltransferase [Mycobacteriales bacterium]|nr:glycosyltransferase [Mycobacteriales bacterium]